MLPHQALVQQAACTALQPVPGTSKRPHLPIPLPRFDIRSPVARVALHECAAGLALVLGLLANAQT